MDTFLFVFALVIGFCVLLYKASQHEPTEKEKEQQRVARMSDDERHDYYEKELEKIHEKEREKCVKYVEPSNNILGTEIMGIKYRSAEAKLAAKCLVPGELLHLRMEPKNRYDKFAVKILTEDDIFIGYVQKEYSEFVTRNIDCVLECRVSCVPDEVQKIVWGISQCYGAVLYFTEDVEIPDDE